MDSRYEELASRVSADAPAAPPPRPAHPAELVAVLQRSAAAEAPTHCLYCGKPLPERGPSKTGPRQKYCNDDCRFAAHAASKRIGKPLALPSPTARHVAYGDDVLSAQRALLELVPELRARAEQLSGALAQAGDLRAAKKLVDEAEQRLRQQEQDLLTDLTREIQARCAAQDLAELAEAAAERDRAQAEAAGQAQASAQAEASRVAHEFEERRLELAAELERVRSEAAQRIATAEARAAAAEQAAEQKAAQCTADIAAAQARAQEQVERALQEQARAESGRATALAEAERAREDARAARRDVELERERGRTELERATTAAAAVRTAHDTAAAALHAQVDELRATSKRLQDALAQSETERRLLLERVMQPQAQPTPPAAAAPKAKKP